MNQNKQMCPKISEERTLHASGTTGVSILPEVPAKLQLQMEINLHQGRFFFKKKV